MSLSKLQAIFPCFACTGDDDASSADQTYPDEKATLLSSYHETDDVDESSLLATSILTTLLSTHKSGVALRMHLDASIGTTNWTSTLAKYLLENLTQVLRDGHEHFGPALRDAYERATRVALSVEGFVVEHPVFCTVVALGVLAVMTPWVLGLLGFVEVGIVEGSFAARWMSMYGGLVPKGSLFSFFQRLGMVAWRWVM